MKNIIFYIVLVLGSVNCVAQDTEYKLGLLSSCNYISVIHFAPEIPDDYFSGEFGYNAGAEFSMKKNNVVNLTFLYSKNYFSYDENEEILGQYYGWTNLNSIYASSSVDFYLTKKGRVFVRIGAFSNYLMSAYSKFDGRDDTDETNSRKRFNYGIVSGIGVSIPLFNSFSGSVLLHNNFWLSSYNRMISSLPSVYLNETMLSIKLSYILEGN